MKLMSVFVRFITGKTIIYECTENDTALDLKRKIFKDQKMSVESQKIIYDGRMVNDDEKILYLARSTTVLFCLVYKGG